MVYKSRKITSVDAKASPEDLARSVNDLAKYVDDEFAEVASAIQGADPRKIWNAPPPKPRRALEVYADGTNWNPGAGEGAYFFNGTLWVPEFGIRYDIAQPLTPAQQAQALTNIGGAPYDAEASNNIIVNGGMEVDQANAGAATAGNSYAIDSWVAQKAGTMACNFQQVSDAPPGFANSLKITVGTAEASLGAGDFTYIYQPIEGIRTSRLQFGTATALSFTLGFWTKIHRTGVYSGSIRNNAGTRSYPFTFTQNVADTWEYKTVTIPGDLTGAWIGNTNGLSLFLSIAMAVGSTFTGTANAWAAANLIGATGSTNGVAATSDVFQITGVTIIPGIIAPTAAQSVLLKRSFDRELVLCKRYLWRWNLTTNEYLASGQAVTATIAGIQFPNFQVQMRVAPTVTFSSPVTDFKAQGAGGAPLNVTSFSSIVTSVDGAAGGVTCSGGGLVAGNGTQINCGVASQWLMFDSRL